MRARAQRQWERILPKLRDRDRWRRLIVTALGFWLMSWALHFTWGVGFSVAAGGALFYWLQWPRAVLFGGTLALAGAVVSMALEYDIADVRPFLSFGIMSLLGVLTFAEVPVIPRAWRWCWGYITRVRSGEIEAQEHWWRHVCFLVFVVAVVMFGARLDYVEVVAWIILVGGLLFRWDHRIAASLTMGFLVSTPILLIAKKDAIAESMGIYAYCFLVVMTLQLVAASRRDREGEDDVMDT